METDLLFVEFCALVCVVALSFRLVRLVRRRRSSAVAMKAAARNEDDWYCFFRPSGFRRSRASAQRESGDRAKRRPRINAG